MREINLLPPKQRQKRFALGLVTYLTLGFIILLITLGGFVVTLTTIQVTINDKVSNYDTQTAAIQKHSNAFKSVETDLTTANQALHLAGDALTQQMHPTNYLNLIASKVGPSIVLTNISLAPPTAATKSNSTLSSLVITIAGVAKDRTSIIDFKRALQEDNNFSNVVYSISDTSTTNASSSDLNFTISMGLAKAPGGAK